MHRVGERSLGARERCWKWRYRPGQGRELNKKHARPARGQAVGWEAQVPACTVCRAWAQGGGSCKAGLGRNRDNTTILPQLQLALPGSPGRTGRYDLGVRVFHFSGPGSPASKRGL